MSNIDAEARERGAQLTARIAQRAVIAPKLAEALRNMEFYARQVPFMDRTTGLIDAMNAARAALAEWEAQS